MPNAPIQPAPVPTDWAVDHTPDGKYIVIIKMTHQGQTVDFLTFDNMVSPFMAAMLEHAEACAALRRDDTRRLVVPSSVLVGADGQPLLVVDPSQPALGEPTTLAPPVTARFTEADIGPTYTSPETVEVNATVVSITEPPYEDDLFAEPEPEPGHTEVDGWNEPAFLTPEDKRETEDHRADQEAEAALDGLSPF